MLLRKRLKMLEFKFIYGETGYKIAEYLRKKVFSEELGMPDIMDEFEDKSYHFVGYDKAVQVGVARLTKIDEKNFTISFVAVKDDYRRQYVGDLIMRALQDKAVSLGGVYITIVSPDSVKGFFEFEGYEQTGEEFLEDGKKFIKMKKDLTKIEPCRGCGK